MRKPVKIAENIFWVGAIDRDLRSFHGYSTHRGSTYNAYLVIDQKITLIDTVKAPFAGEMLERISEICDPAKIEIIISNHAEGDHSGAIPALLTVAKKAKVYATAAGEKALRQIYRGCEMDITAVKTGDKLSTGAREFTFYQTPMVHWPDNMVTYCASEKILFSNDAFGQHYATEARFDDEVDFGSPLHVSEDGKNVVSTERRMPSELLYETKKYYANIVMPYGGQVQKALEALSTLPIRMIAPSHGVIWRTKIAELLGMYDSISRGRADKTAIIVYGTMWHSTGLMAEAVAEGFKEAGWRVKLYDIDHSDKSDIMTEILECGAVAVGSSTLNNQMLPPVADFLCYLKGLDPRDKIFAAFGSYGWSGKSAELVHAELSSTKMQPLCPAFKCQNVPEPAELDAVTCAVREALLSPEVLAKY